jgi:DNA-binding NarL/FixJ family response regulator
MRADDPAWDAHPVRCLIVDDSPGFQVAASRLLEFEGMTIAGVASTTAEALLLAEELRPDVILIDVDLGGESGLELDRRLHGRTCRAPFQTILVSTHDEQDYRDLIAASPAIGFLPKTALSAHAILELLAGSANGSRGT